MVCAVSVCLHQHGNSLALGSWALCSHLRFVFCSLFSKYWQLGMVPHLTPDQESPHVRPTLCCTSRIHLHAPHRMLGLTSTVFSTWRFRLLRVWAIRALSPWMFLALAFLSIYASSAPLFQKFPELSWPQWFLLSYFLYFVTLLFLYFTGQARR